MQDMKNSAILIFIIALLGSSNIYGQEILGTWKAIDDVDGKATSHILISNRDGKLYGAITNLLEYGNDSLCQLCKGDKKDQPIVGMEIIWDMKQDGKSWSGGRILDPESGKDYKCNIKLVDGVLEVRGYIGIPALGRTQKWYRVE